MKKLFGALAIVAVALVLVTSQHSMLAAANTPSTPTPPPIYSPAPGALSSSWRPIANVNDAVTVYNLPTASSACAIEVEGNLASFSVAIEVSQDGLDWYAAQNTLPSGAAITANGQMQVTLSQFKGIRARLASTGSGGGWVLIVCGPSKN